MYIDKLVSCLEDRHKIIMAMKELKTTAETLLNQKLVIDSKIDILTEVSGKSNEELQREVDEYAKKNNDTNTTDAEPKQLELFNDEVATDIDTDGESHADFDRS